MKNKNIRLIPVGGIVATVCAATAMAQQPEYEIVSLGIVGEFNSGADAVSQDGQFAIGFSDSAAFLWQDGNTSALLPGEASRPFSVPRSINNSGVGVGIGATTFFGSNPLPIIWQDNIVMALPLPPGQSIGRAYAINNSNTVAGSVNGGSLEQATVYQPGGSALVLPQTLAGGTLTTAYGINDAGRIVGQALDPTNAAVTKGFYLDEGDTEASDIGALAGLGHNSAIAFAVSETGLVAGTSSFNSGVNSRGFVWSEDGGMIEVPLPTDTSSAGARGVNSSGWVVGTATSAFAVPYLYDGTQTYRLQDLIVSGDAGWNLQNGTSNGAFSIADNGTIVGRGLLDGSLRAFAMRLIVSDSDGDGLSDDNDNCPQVANADQRDTNGDGFGNVCDPDLNNDLVVNFIDLGILRAAFFSSDPDADFNGDGVVNFIDLGVMRSFFFSPPG